VTSVLILLAVYQGESYLAEQIDSLAGQSIETVHVLASDDGSTDGSRKILEAAKRSWTKGNFQIIDGPQQGFARNFRELILNSKIEADYFAFCDQDDIWDKDKLERAVTWSTSLNSDTPQVFAGRTRLIDETGKPIGLSHLIQKKPDFRNAVLQNIAGGNTMVMNKAAMQLLVKTAKHIGAVSHDYWLYIIVTGAGGIFHYNPQPSVSYRQHQSNAIGDSNSWRRGLWRFNKFIKGQVRLKSDQRLAAMLECTDIFDPSARFVLEQYRLVHGGRSVGERLGALHRSGIHRHNWVGQMGLYVDCIFKLQ